MTPNERDRWMFRFVNCWPTPRMADETVMIWNEHLDKMNPAQAREALANLERSSSRRPSIADLWEHYRALDSKYRVERREIEAPDDDACSEEQAKRYLALIRESIKEALPRMSKAPWPLPKSKITNRESA